MFAQTTPIVNQIEKLVSDIPGWTPIDQLYTLYLLALGTRNLPGDIIEVGSWCGRSSTVLAHAVKVMPGNRLYCIDLFPNKDDWYENKDGSYSFNVVLDGVKYAGYHEQTVWKEPFDRDIKPVYATNNNLFQIFIDNVTRKDCFEVVTPYRGTLDSFVSGRVSSLKCKMAFIDGDHGYQAVKDDINRIIDILVPGGWICFDDAFTYYDGVDEAITECVIRSEQFDPAFQATRKLFVARRRLVS